MPLTIPVGASPDLRSLVKQLEVAYSRVEPIPLGARYDGSDMYLRFRAAVDAPYVMVHVQSTGSGKGGVTTFDATHYVSEDEVDCRSELLQEFTVASPVGGDRYAAWLIPEQLDPATGSMARYDGQSGRPDRMAVVGLGVA